MNLNDLLIELNTKINQGEVTKDEVSKRLGLQQNTIATEPISVKRHLSLTKVLYGLGAAIVVIGVVIFAAQVWEDIGAVGRIGITFGFGVLMTGIGSMLFSQEGKQQLGKIFHFIGGVLIPGGSMVLLNELGGPVDSIWPVAITFGVIFAFYMLLTYAHKHDVLTLLATINGTIFAYLVTGAILEDMQLYRLGDDIFAYLTMVIGASYLLLAQAFDGSWNKRLLPVLNFFGTAGILGAGFTRVFDSGLWELLFFFLVFGGMYFSARIKSSAVLVVSTLFLIAHIIYITGEYFADSLGWPVALILLGFVIIGLAYGSITFNKRFIKGQE